MSLVFVSLSIPILIFILVYHYDKTSAAIIATLHEQVAKTRGATIDSAQNLIEPVVHAAVAADRGRLAAIEIDGNALVRESPGA